MPDPSVLTGEAEGFIDLLTNAPTLHKVPVVADVARVAPPNPPRELQAAFVGASYRQAYEEALSFVRVANSWSQRRGRGPIATLSRVLDFGSGWGRISRVLASQLSADAIVAADVDQEMTALVSTTLPGINAITVKPAPPTFLGEQTMDLVTAFSVFSHLSEQAHQLWAAELARVLRPEGLAVITVLDDAFFGQLRSAQRSAREAGAGSVTESLAALFPDVAVAEQAYHRGELVYAGVGGGGVRTGDYYGWAAAPTEFVSRVWSAAGLDIVEWVPAGVLFPQACVALRRRPSTPPAEASTSGRRAMARAATRRHLPPAVRSALRSVTGQPGHA